jgi:hypothetical protein
MSLTYPQAAELVRGRLGLGSSAKLRIQKEVSNALQIFSERLATDENKRHLILTPRTVVGTPTNGILDLATLVTSDRIMVDKLHLGRLYHVGGRTFVPGDVDTAADTITVTDNTIPDGTLIQFTATGGSLPFGLGAGTDYYKGTTIGDTFQVFTDSSLTSLVDLTSSGSATFVTISTPNTPDPAPMQRLKNPNFTSMVQPWADTTQDKFWWLIGNSLYCFKGDRTPINTPVQFNVPHTIALTEFGTSSPIGQLQDEFIDALTELFVKAEAERDADGE